MTHIPNPSRRFRNGDIMRFSVALITAFVLVVSPFLAPPAVAQNGWNDTRTLELVDRAITRRFTEVVDSALQSYKADARGFIYFLLDSPELGRQSLVRTDQVAVQLYWRAPDDVRQRVVGWRNQKELPITRLYYYLDRLTVVQDNYGEAIVIADGDNVRDVPHPIARGGPAVYDYQLVDSLTLNLPGMPGPVTVHEVQVRPKDASVPAVIGRVYLEAGTGALVRMTFTFTASSYVDPRLDYINVTLSNGLWLGRFWLPHEQSLDIRREMPELDLPFGTVIRTRMRVGPYVFNESTNDVVFASPLRVAFAPPAERENFPFEQEIDAEWRMEGLAEPVEVEQLRREAMAIVRERAISGLQTRRPGFGSVSDLIRYNRADGAVIGAGAGFQLGTGSARLHAGWAFGADQPTARFDLSSVLNGGAVVSGTAYLNRTGDVGGTTPSSRAANSLSTLFLGEDWTDPFHASGVAGNVRLPSSGIYAYGVGGRIEHQRPAELTTTYSFFGEDETVRPVRAVDRGTHLSAELSVRRETGSPSATRYAELRAGPGALIGSDTTFLFGRAIADAGLTWSTSERRASVEVGATARALVGQVPAQELFLIGGRGTLPGFDFRTFGGDRAVTARALGSADILHPWLRGRASGFAGWAGASGEAERATGMWDLNETGGVRASLGVGVGVFYDLLHIDVVRGLGEGGKTQLQVEVQPAFWGFL